MVIYMENNVRRYRVFLYIFLGFAIGMFCWASYSYYKQSVPDTIRIKAGTSEEINFGIPASGQILADSTRVIALNQPVKIVAGKRRESYEMELKLFGVLPLKNVDIEVIKDKIESSINPRKWVCVGVEEDDVIVENEGNLIILIMIEDETTREKIV